MAVSVGISAATSAEVAVSISATSNSVIPSAAVEAGLSLNADDDVVAVGARVDDALLEGRVNDAVGARRDDEHRAADAALRVGGAAAAVEPLRVDQELPAPGVAFDLGADVRPVPSAVLTGRRKR